jgi:hypothetical protein
MMGDIAGVTAVEITAKDSTQSAFASVKSGLTGLGNAADSIKGSMAALGGVLAVGGFAAMIKSSIDAADHLNDLSKRTGIAVETLGGLGYAAEQSGADLDAVVKGAGKLAQQMAAAATGNKDAAAAFDLMGVSVTDGAGKLRGLDEVLFDVADKFEGYEDGAAKSALATELMKKGGEALIPFLDEGGKKLRELVAEYQRYGGITTDTAQRADAFNDTLGKIRLIQGAFFREMASALLPTLQALANIFVDVKGKGEGFATVGTALVGVVKTLGIAAIGVSAVFEVVGKGLAALAVAAISFIEGDYRQAWAALKNGFGDAVATVGTAMDRAATLWNASSATIAVATDTNIVKKTAAPLIKAAKDIGDAFGDLQRTLQQRLAGLKDLGELEKLTITLTDKKYATLTPRQVAELQALAKQIDAEKEYQEILKARIRLEEQLIKEEVELAAAATRALGNYKEQNDRFALEVSLQFKSNTEREKALALADAEIERRKLITAGDVQGLAILDTLIQQRLKLIDAREEQAAQIALWQTVERAAHDAATNIEGGFKGMLNRLRDTLKSGLLELLYEMTVKKWVINLQTQVSGQGGGFLTQGAGAVQGAQNLLGLGGGQGGGLGGVASGAFNTFAMSGAGESLGLSGALTAQAGSLSLGVEAGAEAAALTTSLTATGASLAAAIPVIGWAVAAAYAIYSIVQANKKPAEVRGQFGVQSGTGGFEDNAVTGSRFGNLGFLDAGTQQFSGEVGKVMSTQVAGLLDIFAARFNPAQQSATTAALQSHNFGSMEGTFTTEDFLNKYGSSILKQVASIAFNQLDPAFATLVDKFQGTNEETAKYIASLVVLHDQLEKLPAGLRDNLVAALDGTQTAIENVTKVAVAFGVVQDVLNANPLDDALKIIGAEARGAYGALMDAGTSIRGLIDKFDNTADSATNLANATLAYYNAQVQLLAQLERVRNAITGPQGMFANTERDLRLSTLDNTGKYNFYSNEISTLRGQLATATDPAQIQAIAARINDDITAAFGLLDPAQQRQMLDAFVGPNGLTAQVATQVNARLTNVETDVQTSVADVLGEVRDTLKQFAVDMAASAHTQQSAADTNLAAAHTPLVVNVVTVVPDFSSNGG